MQTNMRPPDLPMYLPLYAKCALEYLDAQGHKERSIAKLDSYLSHYATTMGSEVDEHVRYSAHAIAMRRFSGTGMDFTGCTAEWHMEGSAMVCRYSPASSSTLCLTSQRTI